jgi:hypothetical protein
MKGHRQAFAFATAVLALPLLVYSQNATDQSMQGSQAPIAGHHEATLMKPARAVLVHSLDADKDQSGCAVSARLQQKVTLTNGTELAKGTMLLGKVTTDDMQQRGISKLALRFDQAHLKNGTIVPIRATIVGLFSPQEGGTEINSADYNSGEVPNEWTAKTLQLDQLNVVPGVDLHSKISSRNSGVFVSTKKSDVKLSEGSEIQFAIAPGTSSANSAMSNKGQSGMPAGE